MTEVVYNACYGGFGLTKEAIQLYLDKGGDPEAPKSYSWDRYRSDPILVEVVKHFKDKANGSFANLEIADIPKGSRYRIDEYDGYEAVKTIEDYEWLEA